MFINVSNQLPKTSYIKMMDVWLIFNLILPFSEVLLHTYKVILSASFAFLNVSFQDYLRDEKREVNHHGRVRKLDADGNEVDEDYEEAPKVLENNWVGGSQLQLDLISRKEDVQVRLKKLSNKTKAIK